MRLKAFQTVASIMIPGRMQKPDTYFRDEDYRECLALLRRDLDAIDLSGPSGRRLIPMANVAWMEPADAADEASVMVPKRRRGRPPKVRDGAPAQA